MDQFQEIVSAASDMKDPALFRRCLYFKKELENNRPIKYSGLRAMNGPLRTLEKLLISQIMMVVFGLNVNKLGDGTIVESFITLFTLLDASFLF